MKKSKLDKMESKVIKGKKPPQKPLDTTSEKPVYKTPKKGKK